MKKTVAILGGGPCGLSAAWELSRGGDFDVVVLEKEARPGGLCITNERNGYRFDLGGHRFISKNQQLVDDVCKMMGDQLLTSVRRSAILMGGREFKYPLAAKDMLLNMDILTSVKAFGSYLLCCLSKNGGTHSDDSFQSWVENRFGKTLYDIFFGPYTEKLWGIPPSEISSDWASQRISLLNLGDVLLRLIKLKGGTPRTYAQKYFYPKKGIGQMFDMMGDVITDAGSSIIYNAEVKKVDTEGGNVKRVVYDVNGKVEAIDCDFVISTIPLTDLVEGLCDTGVSGLAQDIGSLKFRAVRFMNIMVDRQDISDKTWMYVSERKYLMTRIQEPKRRSRFSAPAGKTSVMLEIPCDVGDDIWGADDAVILDRCVADLFALGIDIKDEVTDHFSTYVTHGYPVYSLDYDRHRRRLIDLVHGFNNILTCGRQGTFRYIFMDTAMDMGITAARRLRNGRGLEGSDREDICGLDSKKELLEVAAVTA